ncbi:MAG: gluconeogenesis factor YvcK family protein, partial [Clostridia bacterium]|nr:gluconeogenesis factor YvcK family protein [Clostridia bacterium]
MKNKKIVVIGGGTGLSTLLRGLKLYTNKITAVVTVADDGGSSGRLRDDLGMLPPGDVRNCVSALAETDTVWQELMNFRFSEGTLSGHSLGNLTLAALNEMSQSFEEAVMKFNQLMGVSGIVYPVTNESVVLSAVLEDGTLVEGESNIGTYREGENKSIKEIYMTPEKPEPVSGVI